MYLTDAFVTSADVPLASQALVSNKSVSTRMGVSVCNVPTMHLLLLIVSRVGLRNECQRLQQTTALPTTCVRQIT